MQTLPLKMRFSGAPSRLRPRLAPSRARRLPLRAGAPATAWSLRMGMVMSCLGTLSLPVERPRQEGSLKTAPDNRMRSHTGPREAGALSVEPV